MMKEEMSGNPKEWLYLSFADETGFLGGAIVQGWGTITATFQAHNLGINPGGEVLCMDIPQDRVIKETTNRLLSKVDMDFYYGKNPLGDAVEASPCSN